MFRISFILIISLYASLALAALTNPGDIAPSTASASLTTVNNNNSSFAVVASNTRRKGLVIYNNSSTNCNIAFAASASNVSFTFQLTASSTFVMTAPIYTGAVSGICAAATGTLQVTEL